METPPKKTIDELMEQFNVEHKISIDITHTTSHSDFVEGANSKVIGFKVNSGEPSQIIKGARKTIFNLIVLMYVIFPLILIPIWCYSENNWILLIGIAFSYGASFLATLKGNKIGGLLLIVVIAFWVFKGIHSYYTFFSLCALWGYMFFQIAESCQTEYAMQSLLESPDLYNSLIAQKKITILRKRA